MPSRLSEFSEVMGASTAVLEAGSYSDVAKALFELLSDRLKAGIDIKLIQTAINRQNRRRIQTGLVVFKAALSLPLHV